MKTIEITAARAAALRVAFPALEVSDVNEVSGQYLGGNVVNEIRERMGDATEAEAEAMASILEADEVLYTEEGTDRTVLIDLPESYWLRALELAGERAANA